ncbi:hypothetical protein SAMN05443246_4926 [Paenibacillus sp. GP183]|nr:hypothetical protein SAMN05443246_4926 [Paenibacillus sp. GP183]
MFSVHFHIQLHENNTFIPSQIAPSPSHLSNLISLIKRKKTADAPASNSTSKKN